MSTSDETPERVKALSELLDLFVKRYQADILPPQDTERMKGLLAKRDDKPTESKRELRRWMEDDPDSFWPVAFWVMHSGSDPSASATIRTVLRVADDLIGPLLDHHAFSRQDANELAQALRCFHPTLEVALLQRVFNTGTDDASLRRLLRALDIAGTIADGDRIRHQLVILRRIRDRRVQSKLTLILARRVRETEWIEQQFEDPDPRVRANVVEGLWDAADSKEKRALLWRATHDTHNRVLGNALVGLVRMKDVEAFWMLDSMSRNPSAAFRASAAWAMGETGDPRFAEQLRKMVRKETGGVRRNALQALVRLRKATRATEATGTEVA